LRLALSYQWNIEDREDLLIFTPEEFTQRFRVQVLTETEAVAVQAARKKLELRRVRTGESFFEDYDELVLSPGAEPIRPPLPGVELPGVYTLRNVPDLDRIMKHIQTQGAKKAVVVGAGFIGIEVAENLVERGLDTFLIEKAPQVIARSEFEGIWLLEFWSKMAGMQSTSRGLSPLENAPGH
jgi:tRNA 2-thiouridine synthesizing protein A